MPQIVSQLINKHTSRCWALPSRVIGWVKNRHSLSTRVLLGLLETNLNTRISSCVAIKDRSPGDLTQTIKTSWSPQRPCDRCLHQGDKRTHCPLTQNFCSETSLRHTSKLNGITGSGCSRRLVLAREQTAQYVEHASHSTNTTGGRWHSCTWNCTTARLEQLHRKRAPCKSSLKMLLRVKVSNTLREIAFWDHTHSSFHEIHWRGCTTMAFVSFQLSGHAYCIAKPLQSHVPGPEKRARVALTRKQ